ncbi:MAG: hypothetical protein ACERKN_19150 [Velocimicrobium sp.]
MDTVSTEKAAVLWNELMKYEKNTEMTDDERKALREWVLDGNSVHDNGSMAYTEHGVPCDFLDVYRYEEGIYSDLEKLSPKEQENYLARLRGEDTIDNLREDLDKLFFKSQIYELVLGDHCLIEEANLRIKAAEDKLLKQKQQFNEWRMENTDKELPFD